MASMPEYTLPIASCRIFPITGTADPAISFPVLTASVSFPREMVVCRVSTKQITETIHLMARFVNFKYRLPMLSRRIYGDMALEIISAKYSLTEGRIYTRQKFAANTRPARKKPVYITEFSYSSWLFRNEENPQEMRARMTGDFLRSLAQNSLAEINWGGVFHFCYDGDENWCVVSERDGPRWPMLDLFKKCWPKKASVQIEKNCESAKCTNL